MRLIPSLECNLQCERSPEDIGTMLRYVTVQKKQVFLGTSKEFTGVISEYGFEITPKLRNRNSFKPVIRGWVWSDGDGSLIHIQMRLRSSVSTFCVVWFGLCFLCMFVGVLSVFTEGIFVAALFLLHSIFMLLWGWFLARFGFDGPAQKSLKRLKELLQGTEVLL